MAFTALQAPLKRIEYIFHKGKEIYSNHSEPNKGAYGIQAMFATQTTHSLKMSASHKPHTKPSAAKYTTLPLLPGGGTHTAFRPQAA